MGAALGLCFLGHLFDLNAGVLMVLFTLVTFTGCRFVWIWLT